VSGERRTWCVGIFSLLLLLRVRLYATRVVSRRGTHYPRKKIMWRTLQHFECQKTREEEDHSPGAEGSATPSTEEYVCLGFSYCFGGRSWALFASFLLFFQKKETAAPSSRNTFASVLVLSNVATYIHSSHYGKFKLSSRFSRGGSNSRRDARDGGTRSRSRTVSRARGGFAIWATNLFPVFLLAF
jgi:hypothetical protein